MFCEGWRPGVADRLGVGYDAIRAVNPAVIYCSISGYGQTGPLVAQPGHDLNYQALAGAVAARPGDEFGPAIPRVPIADLAAANVAALLDLRGVGEAAADRRGRTHRRVDGGRDRVLGGSARRHRASRRRRTGARLTRLRRVRDRGREVSDARGHLRRPLLDGGVRRTGDRRAARAELRAAPRARRGVQRGRRGRGRPPRPRCPPIARLVDAGAPVAPVLTPSEAGRNPQFRMRDVFVDDNGDTRIAFPGRLRVHPVRPPGPAPEPDSG